MRMEVHVHAEIPILEGVSKKQIEQALAPWLEYLDAEALADVKSLSRTSRACQIFSHVGEGILITDADNRIVEVNAAVSRITGYAREELIGETPAIIKSRLHEQSFYDELWSKLKQNGYWHGEIFDRAHDGHILPLLQPISEVHDANGDLTHYISVMTDISSLKETETRLDFLAHHDALTKLPNRLLLAIAWIISSSARSVTSRLLPCFSSTWTTSRTSMTVWARGWGSSADSGCGAVKKTGATR